MKYSDQSYNLRIELDTENCELSAAQLQQLQDALAPLREPVETFPVRDLYVTVEFEPPSNQYRVKLVLQLPGRGLATGDIDEHIYPAFRRSVRKLVHKVTAYKLRMENYAETAKYEKGTKHDVLPETLIDVQGLEDAVATGDYPEFRKLLYPYEEQLRKRIGRWIQRYPDVETQLGERFELEDIVEEVFLNAFERYHERSREVPFGDWLEQLIDPSIKLLHENGDEELSNISFARTAIEARQRPDT